MRIVAFAFYGIGALALAFVVLVAVALGREYGFDLGATLGWFPIAIVAGGLPAWIGSLFHRAARDQERTRLSC